MKDKKQRGKTEIKVLLEYADSIIATLREPFLVLDKNLRVISTNEVFYTTFEVKESDTIGRPLPDLGNRQWNIPRLLQLLKEILPEKKVVKDYEVEHKFEQIGERIMVLNACQLRVPKKIAGIIAAEVREEEEEEELILLAIEDITERKRLQEELKVKEALIETAKIKSAFTSMVSHELRTPLSALKESVSQVLEGMLGTLTADQRKLLDIAKRNVDRLARLITEVLDFQTLETGKMVFKIQDNDMNKVVKETKETMNIIAKEKGLDLILNLDKELPKIKFDRDKISQVLANLVNNSLKLTEKGNITISTTKGNNIIQVSIKDTGPGIKEEDMPRLFQQYEQLERKAGGTGLGLAISLEIIKAHGGKIWAESKFGHGTTMRFILPIEERRRRT